MQAAEVFEEPRIRDYTFTLSQTKHACWLKNALTLHRKGQPPVCAHAILQRTRMDQRKGMVREGERGSHIHDLETNIAEAQGLCLSSRGSQQGWARINANHSACR